MSNLGPHIDLYDFVGFCWYHFFYFYITAETLIVWFKFTTSGFVWGRKPLCWLHLYCPICLPKCPLITPIHFLLNMPASHLSGVTQKNNREPANPTLRSITGVEKKKKDYADQRVHRSEWWCTQSQIGGRLHDNRMI